MSLSKGGVLDSRLKRFALYLLIFALFLPYFSLAQSAKADTADTSETGQYPFEFGVNYSSVNPDAKYAHLLVKWTIPTNLSSYPDSKHLGQAGFWWNLTLYGPNGYSYTYPYKFVSNVSQNIEDDHYVWGSTIQATMQLYYDGYPNISGVAQLVSSKTYNFNLPSSPTVNEGDTGTGNCAFDHLAAQTKNTDSGQHQIFFTWTVRPGCEIGSRSGSMSIMKPDGILNQNHATNVRSPYPVINDAQEGLWTFGHFDKNNQPDGTNTIRVTYPNTGDGDTSQQGAQANTSTGDDNPCGCATNTGWLGMFVDPICGVMCALIDAMISLANQIIKWFPQAVQAYLDNQRIASSGKVCYLR